MSKKFGPWKYAGHEWWWRDWTWGRNIWWTDDPDSTDRAFDLGPLRLIWRRNRRDHWPSDEV